MLRVITMEDNMEGMVEEIVEEVRDKLEDYLEKEDPQVCPIFGELDLDLDQIIEDVSPVYNKTIYDLMYLYKEGIEDSFLAYGFDKKEEGWERIAVGCYLRDRVSDWWVRNSEGLFEEWLENKEEKDEVL